MKKLTIILFDDEMEASAICDNFLGLPEEKEFLGTWLIEYNQEECYSAISVAANDFIKNTEKTEIIFGIGGIDYENVISKIHTENCEIEVINYKNL